MIGLLGERAFGVWFWEERGSEHVTSLLRQFIRGFDCGVMGLRRRVEYEA